MRRTLVILVILLMPLLTAVAPAAHAVPDDQAAMMMDHAPACDACADATSVSDHHAHQCTDLAHCGQVAFLTDMMFGILRLESDGLPPLPDVGPLASVIWSGDVPPPRS